MKEEHAISQSGERALNDNYTRQPTADPTVTKRAAAPPPTRRERWRFARPTKMMTFWLCLGAVALAIAIGFTWGGWTTTASAQKLANTAAQGAVVQRLATICVANFSLDAAHAQNLTELQALSSSQRATFVNDGGWATMAGQDTPDAKVGSECAKQLLVTASK
jgi:hypothetical protein